MKFLKPILLMCFAPTAVFAAFVDKDAPKTITAPKIEYDIKSKSIKTTGKTQISNTSGQRINLVDSYFTESGKNIYGKDIEMCLGGNAFISAESINRSDEKMVANNAVFTPCHGCDGFGNAWELSTSSLTHDNKNHTMDFDNSVFWVYGLPIMWFPVISMPDPTVKHGTGFLLPNLNSTNNMGTQINLPFYIAFSDTHDMTFTTSYLSQENPLFQIEHRLNKKHSQFRTNGSYTHNKEGDDRWHIFNNDVIEMGENLRTTVYLNRASDKTYLQKYGFYGEQPYLDSGAKVELFGKSGYTVADAHIFQELRSSTGNYSAPSGNILPNIRSVYQTAPIYHETYTTLNADILGISGSGTSSQRMIGEYRVVSPWTLIGGNRLTASASARYDVYNFTNTEMVDGAEYTGVKNRFLPNGYLEWGLPLVKGGKRITQTLEPRARITMMSNSEPPAFALNNDSTGALLSDATLFSDNRFSGLDLWENGTFADYGVRWTATDKTGQSLEIFLGQTYDFTKRAKTDPNSGFHNGLSDYVGRIGYKTSKWIELYNRFRFSEDKLSLRHFETGSRFGTERNYVTVGHIWAAQFIDIQTLDKNINEITVESGIYLTERIGLKFNSIYNITEEHFQRHSGGIIYNHPCYFLSLEYRRDNAVKEDYVGNTTIRFGFGININGSKI